ncbi:MAG: extracellular solute-binding protein [Propionibacteriaceae bacterium]|jgi:multiple sugar transport system substrate-binding protein|nr:extracellular solute-binding protein [Propionibacteriaceae bacterium]
MKFPSSQSWRKLGALVAGVALALSLTACSGGQSSSDTITLWHFFEDREADVLQAVIDQFEALHEGVKVDVHAGQDDDNMRQAIAAGEAIDVGISYSRDQVGVLCSSGAFKDLAPFIARDNLDLSDIASGSLAYSQYDGTRCALPMLADVAAIYYNTAMLEAAGVAVPKTLEEWADAAVKLTTYNADGSIDILGFMPFMDYYETMAPNLGVAAQAQWLNADGVTSAIGSDPGWVTILNWQKDLIERLGGYQKLRNWAAGLGDEFSEENDFHTGRVAIIIDGEWRTAFLADQAPDLDYGTAPMPVASSHMDAYGAGYVDGNLVGIPRGSKNPDLAWELVKFLALNTEAQVAMGNGLRNVPTIYSALESPDLDADVHFQVFIDAFEHPFSQTMPASVVGTEYLEIFTNFVHLWESGAQTDLAAGLAKVDADITAAIAWAG